MPGFVEACELAHRHRLLGKIGLHLNLTSGYPLSAPIRRCSRFCDESAMFRSRRTRFRLSKVERLAVETEIAAQVRPASIVDCLRRTWIHTITSTQNGLLEQQPSLWRAGMGYGRSDCHATAALGSICPQVLQSSVQHKVANIWPDEDPIFWLLRGRAGDSCGWFRRCGGNGASELREYREHFRWQGIHRNRALVQHSSARELCLAGIGCYRAVYK
jgi:hypothetical protein